MAGFFVNMDQRERDIINTANKKLAELTNTQLVEGIFTFGLCVLLVGSAQALPNIAPQATQELLNRYTTILGGATAITLCIGLTRFVSLKRQKEIIFQEMRRRTSIPRN